MTKLTIPTDGPRVHPLPPDSVNAYVRSEYDKTVNTWGIPNNLVRTMGWHPGLALTEVDYANSFIFDEGLYTTIPMPGSASPGESVPFPQAGFVDRVIKELVINLVSLLNKSRYSITHHTVIAYTTLCDILPESNEKRRRELAEELLFNLVDDDAQPSFERAQFRDRALYSELQVHCLTLATKLQSDAHQVTDDEFEELRASLRDQAERQIEDSILSSDARTKRKKYVDAYVNAMIVELTWCIVHFAGLLNKWFTVLKVMDESDAEVDGIDFVSHYNSVVPDRIKEKNNRILGKDGWGLVS